MIIGAAIKELREAAMQTFVLLVRHYTMVAVAQECGPFAYTPEPNKQIDLDALILVDALAVIMGHEERELCKPGHIGLVSRDSRPLIFNEPHIFNPYFVYVVKKN